MIAVSDTTALTTLMKAGLDEILPGLFGEVIIPNAVARELLQFHPALPSWCRSREAEENPMLQSIRLAVDPGEAEAISLAHDLKATVVLLDDKKGRRQAEAIGLVCLTLPAVLVAAKRNRYIQSLAAALAAVAEKGRYRVAEEAALVLLRSVGEASVGFDYLASFWPRSA